MKKIYATLLFFAVMGWHYSQGPLATKEKISVSKDSIKKGVFSVFGQNVVKDSLFVEDVKYTLYKKNGHASYYADKFHGRRTASGEKFDMNKMTAAHKKLPFGTKIRVTNEANGKSVIVTVNDRGPFVKAREIDLSKKAFMAIASNHRHGGMKVTIETISKSK